MKYNRTKSRLEEHQYQVAKAIKLYLDADSYEEFQLNRDMDNIPVNVGRYYWLNTFWFINRFRNWTGHKSSVEGLLNISYFSAMILMYVSAVILIAMSKCFWLVGLYFPFGYFFCDFLRKICNLDHTIRYFERHRDINNYYDNFRSNLSSTTLSSTIGSMNISATITTSNGNTVIGTKATVNKPKTEKTKVSLEEILD